MKYMMMIKHTKDYANAAVPPGLYEAMGAFIEEHTKSGVFKDGAGLKPTGEGFKIQMRARKLKTIDGPFTESKEIVGGYAIVDVPTREKAYEIAQRFMEIHLTYWPEFEGESEVRPFEDM